MNRAPVSSLLALLLVGCSAPQKISGSAAPAAAIAPDLRVMTFNIQSGRQGLDEVAALIREHAPDVVALQEVDKGTRRSSGADQAEGLARLTGMQHFAHFRAATLHGGDYGVAVLSRHPIIEAKRFSLPTPRGLESRAVARTVLNVEGEEISVYVTHLTNRGSLSHVRVRQARFISRLMSEDPRPRILAGDLNDAPDSPALLLLSRQVTDAFATAGRGPSETYPLPFPLPWLRLDYLLACDHLRAVDAWVVRRTASDHLPVVADFVFARRSGQTTASR